MRTAAFALNCVSPRKLTHGLTLRIFVCVCTVGVRWGEAEVEVDGFFSMASSSVGFPGTRHHVVNGTVFLRLLLSDTQLKDQRN